MKKYITIVLLLLIACKNGENRDIPIEYPLIAYTGFTNNSEVLFLMDFNGNNKSKISNYFSINPQFSPTNSQLIFMESFDTNYSTYIYDYEQKSYILVSEYPDFDHTYSADGSKIVFKSNRDGISEIYIMDSDG